MKTQKSYLLFFLLSFFFYGNVLAQDCGLYNSWTYHNSGISTSGWGAIAYGDNKLVMVNASQSAYTYNRVKISEDEENWATYGTANGVPNESWMDVTYGNGKFVAVASSGTSRVMISEDGINWTAYGTTNGIPANEWKSITYGNGKFVAIAQNGTNRVMVSENGINWTSYGTANGVPANEWRSITYGNGKFIAVARSGINRLMVSEDGINWTSYGTASGVPENEWNGIAFGEYYGTGYFVAVAGSGANRAMRSTDGINWTAVSTPSYIWLNVTYGYGKFVAVGRTSIDIASSQFMVSTSAGLSWGSTGSSNGYLTDIVYKEDKFIAIYNSNYTGYDFATSSCTPNISSYYDTYDLTTTTPGESTFVGLPVSGINLTSNITITISGDDADQFATLSMLPASGGTLYIIYQPTQAGSHTATITLSGTGAEDKIITLNGTAAGLSEYEYPLDCELNWTSYGTANGVEASTWLSITYGNGKFVAVAQSGTNRVMTSEDGINWNVYGIANGVETSTWSSITYGNGKFVAVARNGTNRVMVSEDGVSWASYGTANGIEANTWSSITYGNGKFVAVAYGGTNRVMTSENGINWTSYGTANGVGTSNWQSITYGNEKFVAVAYGGTNRVMTSEDGINWTSYGTANGVEANSWQGITYGNGKFVAVAQSGTNKIMTSEDGISWTAYGEANGVPEEHSWAGIVYGNGIFMASNGPATIVSQNGTDWAELYPAFGDTSLGISLVYADNKFVVVKGSGSDRVLTGSCEPLIKINTAVIDIKATEGSTGQEILNVIGSNLTDDITATISGTDASLFSFDESSLPQTGGDLTIMYQPETTGSHTAVVTLSSEGAENVTVIITGQSQEDFSNCELHWSSYDTPENNGNGWCDITYGNGKFVASAYYGTNRVMVSEDGENWTSYGTANGVAQNPWWGITYGNGKFVAVAQTGTSKVMVSEDGIGWTSYGSSNGVSDNQWRSITYGNGKFVAIASYGSYNRVMVSEDGISWTSYGINNGVMPNSWWKITYGKGKFVAIAQDGTNRVMVSENGIDWLSYGLSNGVELNNWMGITYGSGKFVAVAQNGTNRVMVSEDGINWTAYGEANGIAPNSWQNITYAGGKFVAVVSTGTNKVMISEDGINWTSYGTGNGIEPTAWQSIAYGNEKFAAVAYGKVMVSECIENAVWLSDNEWLNDVEPSIIRNTVIQGELSVGTDYDSFAAKTLIVKNTGSLTIENESSVTVAGRITNQTEADNFIVENGGALLQTDATTNEGAITVNRTSNPMFRLDYTLWSSPVANQNLQSFSPETLPTRIYKYDAATDSYYNNYPETVFQTGEGYLFRSPNNWIINDGENTAQEYNGVFTGVPNNGDVPVTVTSGSFNSLGNPYPSAIDAEELFSANPDIQAIYFWTNSNPPVEGVYTANNWASWTTTGGTSADGSTIEPNGEIAVGQGFIAQVNGGTSVTFDNNMRISGAGMFFRTMQHERHRLWLNLISNDLTLNQILIGYVSGATQGEDNQIDGEMFGYAESALYSLIDNSDKQFVIQGRLLPFEATDVVPLGFRATTAGEFTISLANFNGLFAENQDIYLKDNVAQVLHNLKESAYSFISEEGTFDTRFEVVYQTTMSVETPDLNSNWIVFKQGDQFQILTQGFDMKAVQVFDMLGRIVYASTAEGTTHTITRIDANQVLIVKITTSDGEVLTKKVQN